MNRLHLEMTAPVRQRLETLRTKTEADSLAEVIRRALAVYASLWDEKERGGRVIVKDSEGKERELWLV